MGTEKGTAALGTDMGQTWYRHGDRREDNGTGDRIDQSRPHLTDPSNAPRMPGGRVDTEGTARLYIGS